METILCKIYVDHAREINYVQSTFVTDLIVITIWL
jgi:hypothetical protein